MIVTVQRPRKPRLNCLTVTIHVPHTPRIFLPKFIVKFYLGHFSPFLVLLFPSRFFHLLGSPKMMKHGHGKDGDVSPEYRAWANMLNRCRSLTAQNSHRYGGRGITVCDRWLDFRNFLSDMGLRPSERHSLDRIDNNKGYSPDNCRWADLYTQANNTRRNVFLTFRGETLTISQWARRIGLHRKTLMYRVRAGWTVERALNQKPNRLNAA